MRDQLEAEILKAMTLACAAPMKWGRDDCALWCANILRDALGYDAAADFRGRYRSRSGAQRVLGKGHLVGALRRAARRHKWKRVDPIDALPGDIAIAMLPNSTTLICRAPGWFVGRSEGGFAALPASVARIAWSVSE